MRHASDQLVVDISIPEQCLRLMDSGQAVREFSVSTARNGPGELRGSECTPRGWHLIRVAIGAGCPPNTVFMGRRPTGEICTPALRARYPERDWILTRILWLSGLERGRNRLGPVDTMRRHIYIHGCPDDIGVGIPASHGCIRMRNADLVVLFDRVRVGTQVYIRG